MTWCDSFKEDIFYLVIIFHLKKAMKPNANVFTMGKFTLIGKINKIFYHLYNRNCRFVNYFF